MKTKSLLEVTWSLRRLSMVSASILHLVGFVNLDRTAECGAVVLPRFPLRLRSNRAAPDSSCGCCVRDAEDRSSPYSCLPLVVVGQVDVVSITVLNAKCHSPVARDRDPPVPLEIAIQRMKSVAGQIQIRRLAGIVEIGQRQRDTVREIGPHRP